MLDKALRLTKLGLPQSKLPRHNATRKPAQDSKTTIDPLRQKVLKFTSLQDPATVGFGAPLHGTRLTTGSGLLSRLPPSVGVTSDIHCEMQDWVV